MPILKTIAAFGQARRVGALRKVLLGLPVLLSIKVILADRIPGSFELLVIATSTASNQLQWQQ
jgi:hypothetical protein